MSRVKPDLESISKIGMYTLLPGLEMAARIIHDQIAQIQLSLGLTPSVPIEEPTTEPSSPTVPVKYHRKNKSGMTPEVRKRLSETNKRKWAALTPRQRTKKLKQLHEARWNAANRKKVV